MRYLVIIFFALSVISCNENQQIIEDEIDTAASLSEERHEIEEPLNNMEESMTIKVTINFQKHKDLLDIILLLPDSVFSSWEWTLKDRTKWYNEIKENDFYTDDNPDYFNQVYFESYKAGFSIVDGFWYINIYKTSENSHIVVTNDRVGGGNEMYFYEVKSKTIKPFSNESIMFSDYREHLKRTENTQNCDEPFEELSYPIFEIDFSSKDKIEIEGSWSLTKENYQNCLIGNAIIYKFNPVTKKFEIEKIYWKPRHDHN
jgi:hypothetical protein